MKNADVGKAVDLILSRLDALCSGEPAGEFPNKKGKLVIDEVISKQKSSVRLATIFLTAYSLENIRWNYKSVPVGIRGVHGDKKLASALTARHVNLHQSITAFGENLGWKGNVRNVNLKNDPRFSEFLADLKSFNAEERDKILNYAVFKLFESRAIPKALPPLPPDYLTFSRALALCESLLEIPSEGHIPQFLVAGFLSVHRSRFGHEVKTHHPHAADTFDNAAGDIEEYINGKLYAAYEVTVRDDWKNRLPDFEKKAAKANLNKYIIFAAGVDRDPQLASASALLEFLGNIRIDLAVVDIRDFFTVFCAELKANEICTAINRTFEFLVNPKLCGKKQIIDLFVEAADTWRSDS